MAWKRSGPHIAAQTIDDDEVIVVNLHAGIYYSMTGSGSSMWNAISGGAADEVVMRNLQALWDATAEEISEALHPFADYLVREGLLIVSEPEAGTAELEAPAERKKFERPSVTKYTDMEDVLLLDPIHDFAESGWPNK